MSLTKQSKRKKNKAISKVIVEDSSWAKSGYRADNYYTFGVVNTVNEKFKRSEDSLQNYLSYATSFINSADAYFRAVYNMDRFVPEGAEVTHSASLEQTDHIPIAQHPAKIDGYYHLYHKTKIPLYQKLADQILLRLVRMQSETRDANGYHWVPLINIVDEKGKFYGYDKGPKNTRFSWNFYPLDQSLAPLETMGNGYTDAWGFGLWELAKQKDHLDQASIKNLKMLIERQLEFYNQPRLHETEKGFYWQTNTIYPHKREKESIAAPKLYLLGQDIIYLYLAGIEIGSSENLNYLSDLEKFLRYYLDERGKLPPRTDENSNWLNKPLWHIEFVDLRAIAAVKMLLKHNIAAASTLDNRLKKILQESYRELPRVKYSEEGLTLKSDSTVLLLFIYDYLDHQELALLADQFLYYNFSYNGIYMRSKEPIEVNMSTYSLLKYVGLYLGERHDHLRMLQKEVLFNLSDILNRPGEVLDNFKWCRTELKEHKRIRAWRAVPDRIYMENVQAEGVWRGNEKQAFLGMWGAATKNLSDKDTDHADSFYRFSAYQFTAPFQAHAEPFPFGRAMTYNMLEILTTEMKEDVLNIECKIPPQLKEGVPVFGAIDITEILYKDQEISKPTGWEPVAIESPNGKFLFTKTVVPEFIIWKETVDHAKIVFAGYWHGEKAITVKIRFKKINKRELVELNEEN